MGWKALVKRDLTPGTQKVQETGIFTDDYKIYKILVTEFDMSDTGYFRCRFLENGVEQTGAYHSIIGRTGSSYASAGYMASRQQGGMHFMGYRSEEDDGAEVWEIFLFEPTNSGLATMMISSGAYMREGSGPDFVFQGNARELGEDITGIQFWTDALVNRISYTIYGLEEV